MKVETLGNLSHVQYFKWHTSYAKFCQTYHDATDQGGRLAHFRLQDRLYGTNIPAISLIFNVFWNWWQLLTLLSESIRKMYKIFFTHLMNHAGWCPRWKIRKTKECNDKVCQIKQLEYLVVSLHLFGNNLPCPGVLSLSVLCVSIGHGPMWIS